MDASAKDMLLPPAVFQSAAAGGMRVPHSCHGVTFLQQLLGDGFLEFGHHALEQHRKLYFPFAPHGLQMMY